MLTHECKGNASYKHLSIKQENIDLYYKNKPRIFATVPKYESSTEKLFNAVATLAEDSYAIRKMKKHHVNRETTRSRVKRIRNEKCVELYKAGVPTDDIKKQVGFRSKSSVFRILKESGVNVDRRRNNEE